MKFKVLKTLIEDGLPPEWADRGVFFHPGPDDPDQPVDWLVVLTVDGGLGLMLDGLLDNVSWQVRVAGPQNMYEDAEDLALAIDKVLMSFIPKRVEDLLITTVYRVGGQPQQFVVDDAERTQFVCSYYFDVESELPPI